MAVKKIYHCVHCDTQYPKWVGQCSQCGKWGSVEEELAHESEKREEKKNLPSGKTVNVKDIQQKSVQRLQTSIEEFDRVVGGGIVPGSLLLLGGDPGIGKSTLTGQVCIALAGQKKNVLYVSGEESAEQVALRFQRLGKSNSHLHFLGETAVESIIGTLQKEKPVLAVIDSIQTVASVEVDQAAGSLTQVRACTVKLLQAAKELGIALFIVGHVTKDGGVAGPKTLEHLVDSVLYLEGDPQHGYRLLRGVKNRFGSTAEVGVFEMKEAGLAEIKDPSKIFLSSQETLVPGSAVTIALEGNRPFLVEIQALISKTHFGYPKRASSGLDNNRVQLLLAVLERRIGFNLGAYDVFVNVVGGYRIKEPAADLAIALAITSAYKNIPLKQKTVVFGEVGLGGEVRNVLHSEARNKEAKHLGMEVIDSETGKTLGEIIQTLFGS